MDKNKLYQHDPEPQEWDVDQSLFDHTPVKQGENSVKYLYDHNQKNYQAENYDDLYNNSQNVRHTKSRDAKKTAAGLTTAMTLIVVSVVGVVAITNPLTSRPRIQNDSYSFENNVLKIDLEISNRIGYDCDLVLLKDGDEINRESVKDKTTYTNEYQIVESGRYELKFISTNNIDYKNSVSLYTFDC